MGSIADFRTRYAEFDDVADARLSVYISDASSECSTRAWGVYWLRGVLSLAAHLLALSQLQGEAMASQGAIGLIGLGAGGAASMTTGRESISYAGPRLASRTDLSPGDALLTATAYGQEHLRLKQRLFLGPVVI